MIQNEIVTNIIDGSETQVHLFFCTRIHFLLESFFSYSYSYSTSISAVKFLLFWGFWTKHA
jgi:hypothetical protein